MRTIALFLIILCELLIALTQNMSVDSNSLSFMTTLIVVVIVAFTFSAMLRYIKSLSLSRNYGISGVIGILVGLAYFMWSRENMASAVEWISNYGLYLMLLIIFLSALIIYYSGPESVKKEAVKPVSPPAPETPKKSDAPPSDTVEM